MPLAGSTAEQRFADRMSARAVPHRAQRHHQVERAERVGQALTLALTSHRATVSVPREILEQALSVANYIRTRPHV